MAQVLQSSSSAEAAFAGESHHTTAAFVSTDPEPGQKHPEEAQGRERPGIVGTSQHSRRRAAGWQLCPATNLDQTLVSTLLDTKLQMEPEGIVLKCIPLLREMTRLRGLGLASKDSAKDDSPPKVNK